jgi:4-amino-4-deoxy-L-arabinose transferase-like glycosyltransferase
MKAQALILSLLFGGALVPRLYGLARESWYDEAFTLLLVKRDFADIVRLTLTHEANPPLYFLLQGLWQRLTPATDFWWNLPAALWGALTIPLLFLLGQRALSRTTGWLAGGLGAFTPVLLQYSQEVRVYSMAACMVTLTLWLLLRAVQEGTHRHWLAYGASLTVLLQTHYYAGFSAVGLALATLLLVWRRRSMWRPAGLSLALPWLLFLPWLLAAAALYKSMQASWWIPTLDLKRLQWTLTMLIVGPLKENPWLYAVCLGGLSAIGFVALLLRRRTAVAVTLLLAMLSPFVIGVLLSLKQSILWPRYLIVMMPPFLVLCAVGLESTGVLLSRQRHVQGGIAALAGAAVITFFWGPTLWSMHRHLQQPEPGFKALAALLEHAAQSGQTVIVDHVHAFLPLRLYRPGLEQYLWKEADTVLKADQMLLEGRYVVLPDRPPLTEELWWIKYPSGPGPGRLEARAFLGDEFTIQEQHRLEKLILERWRRK